MNDYNAAVAQSIRQARLKRRVSQRELAWHIGRQQDRISDIETCGARITVQELHDIAQALDMDIRKLLPKER